MKKIIIPTWRNPYIVMLNGVKYVYMAGEEVEVPDGVAAVIQRDIDAHSAAQAPEAGGGDSNIITMTICDAGAGVVASMTPEEVIRALQSEKIVMYYGLIHPAAACGFCSVSDVDAVDVGSIDYVRCGEHFHSVNGEWVTTSSYEEGSEEGSEDTGEDEYGDIGDYDISVRVGDGWLTIRGISRDALLWFANAGVTEVTARYSDDTLEGTPGEETILTLETEASGEALVVNGVYETEITFEDDQDDNPSDSGNEDSGTIYGYVEDEVLHISGISKADFVSTYSPGDNVVMDTDGSLGDVGEGNWPIVADIYEEANDTWVIIKSNGVYYDEAASTLQFD